MDNEAKLKELLGRPVDLVIEGRGHFEGKRLLYISGNETYYQLVTNDNGYFRFSLSEVISVDKEDKFGPVITVRLGEQQ